MQDDQIPATARRDGLSERSRAMFEERLRRARELRPGRPAIPRAGGRDEFPLAFAQERLWFLYQLDPHSTAYHRPAHLRLGGPLDVAVLEGCLEEIVSRHGALRARFHEKNGRPSQFIADPQPLSLTVVDLSGQPAAKREATARKLAVEETNRPFDLATAAPVRFRLLRLDEHDHVLLSTMHHIVFDGWSENVFRHELSELYAAMSQGRSTALEELPVAYTDFAVWQRELQPAESADGQLAFWRRQLDGAPQCVPLTTDHPREAVRSGSGARVTRGIDADLTAKLNRLSRQTGGTLFMTLFAAFQTLLYRYTGQDDLVVGTPVAGRNRVESEPIIGLFINILPLRTRLAASDTFRNLLGRTREMCLSAFANQDVPFERIVQDFAPERSLGQLPLVQVTFQLRNLPRSERDCPGLQFSEYAVNAGSVAFDLAFDIVQTAGGLTCRVDYHAGLFDRETVERMLAHYEVLLRSVVENADESIGRLPMLTAAERHQLETDWARPKRTYSSELCLHELFEQQVERSPQSVAVTCGDRQLSYGTLNVRANQLARELRARGVTAQSHVALFLERSEEIAVSILGVLKAGGAYVPLDLSDPKPRLQFMLEDADPVLVVTEASLAAELPVSEAPVLLIDDEWDVISRHDSDNLSGATAADGLAYVIYTSGSTGKPKGVLVEHRNATRLFDATRDLFRFEAGDVWTLFHSYCFDLSVWELFGALLTGGRLVVVPKRCGQSAEEFDQLLRRESVTVLNQTPTAFRQLQRLVCTQDEPQQPLKLRYVIFGGETLMPDDLRPWWERFGDEHPRLVNCYGITETTVHVTFRRMTTADLKRPGQSPIGVPFDDLTVVLCDARGEAVPVGVPGEIYVGGDGVARGYLNRDAVTAQRFIADPFDPLKNSRLYRSGDLARRLPSGELEFLGRIDQQVKIRGYRIELGERRAALNGSDDVAQALVAVSRNSSDEPRLIAYVVPDSGNRVSVSKLRRRLKERLPEHMLPAAYVFVERIPLTRNGKVDMRALPAPDANRPELDFDFVPPRSSRETAVAEIWCKLLGIEKVGVYDNFFELGGHSLLAAQFVSHARELFGIEIPLNRVFETPTVEQLAQFLDSANPEDREQALPCIQPVPRDGALPVSFGQEQLWLLEELHPGVPLYNEAVTIRFAGRLDVVALMRCFNEISRRHESLRTGFVSIDGRIVQQIRDQVNLPQSIVDLSAHPVESRIDEALRLASEDLRRPFDLSQPPLMRSSVFLLGDDESLICLACHHIVCDRLSMHAFVNELASLYRAFIENSPPGLDPLPCQAADYSHWQRQCMQAGLWDEHVGYWSRQLDGLPRLDLTTDHPRPAVATYSGAREKIGIPGRLAEALRGFARQERVTPFTLLLTAFKALLWRHTRQDDLAVGTVTGDRLRPEAEGLIGYFLNTLVLRTDLSGDPTFRELLGRVRDVVVAAFSHQHYPFVKLVEELQPERHASRGPLFDVAFVLEPEAPCEHAEWSLTPRKTTSGTSKFDLMLLLDEDPDGMVAVAEYKTDLFEADTIRRMLEQYLCVLDAAIADPDRPISRLPLMSDQQRHRTLTEWGQGVRSERDRCCLHELFERQVEQTPDNDALQYEDETLSYRELNERANQLAHHLKRLGVGPEDRVALCVERSTEMVVAILGILKAGAAYVPLDVTHPSARLSGLIQRSRARVVVTETALQAAVAAGGAPLVILDADAEQIAAGSRQNPMPIATSDQLAYVIYTSGSTGEPKGVAVEHRQIVNYVSGILERFEFQAGTRFAMVSTVAADLGNTVLFPALGGGGCLHVISQVRGSDPELLAEYFDRYEIECLKIVPSHLQALHRDGEPARLMPRRVLILGGEASDCQWVARLQTMAPETQIHNHYGPTETTVGVLAGRIEADDLRTPSGTVPLGRPLPNTHVYILDDDRQPVPPGVAGELYIGGECVSRGYLDDPELTAERFIADPFEGLSKRRMYRTGDRARYLSDGRIEFLGRTDQQIKLRGFRIELGEIEAAIASHPGVREALVLVRSDEMSEPRLIGYVSGTGGLPPAYNGQSWCRLPNGLQVAHLNKNETDYLYHEVFELQAYLRHGISLNHGDCIFDVGANIGLFTAFVGQVCRQPTIYAFEPNPVVFELLKTNAENTAARVLPRPFGLSSENRTAEMTFYEGFSILSGFYADAEAEKEVVKSYMRNLHKQGSREMQDLIDEADDLLDGRFAGRRLTTTLRTLSDVIAEEGVERIHLLKINVEKSELDVLRGIRDEDWEKIDQIVTEVDVPEHRRQIVDLLEGRGYEVCVEQDTLLAETSLCYVYAIRPSDSRRLIADEPAGAHLRKLPPVEASLPTAVELQEYLAAKLPEYMIPRAIVPVERFPLTANGKIDRNALPDPDTKLKRNDDDNVPPVGTVEQTLAGIWSEVLERDGIGRHDNFFQLGGHSLLATRVISRVRKSFGVDVPIRVLFDSPTISGIAEHLAGSGAQSD